MKCNWNGLTQPEKEAYATLCDYFRSYCFEQSEMQHVKPGEELKFDEPPKIHWEPKALGKVKSWEETADGFRCNIKLYSTMDSEKWIKDLLNAGFSAEQAKKFVTIQLEKLTK